MLDAAADRDWAAVEALLTANPDGAREKDPFGQLPLHYAAGEQAPRVVGAERHFYYGSEVRRAIQPPRTPGKHSPAG